MGDEHRHPLFMRLAPVAFSRKEGSRLQGRKSLRVWWKQRKN